MFYRMAVAAASVLWVAACVTETATEPDLPDGAIKRGENFYLVPIGKDDHGCMMYRTHSVGRLVPQVIYYDDRAGGFTANLDDALCKKED